MPEHVRPPARRRDCLRGRRFERDGDLLSLHSGRRGAPDRRRGGGHGSPPAARRSLTAGRPGVLHGNRTYLLQDENGQIIETHSISAGLDYPGVGPEHAWLKDSPAAPSTSRSPMPRRCRPSMTCAARRHHSGAGVEPRAGLCAKLAPTLAKDKILLVNLSGRGDKDMHTVAEIRHQF
jgi:tryptophan synthase beta subunit